MKCNQCSHSESKVLESRDLEEGAMLRRRRECLSCSFRFTTYERIEPQTLLVVKKDGSKEEFDPEKILSGLVKACEKRPINEVDLKDTVCKIEQIIREKFKEEIGSKEIGKIVLKHLKDLDEVAYLRFISVYKDFKTARGFAQELNRI